MPVLVAPADTRLGVALVAALRADGAEVRAYATGDGDVGALRAAGAFVSIGDLDDEGRMDAAMTDAHTVVALHADPLVADVGIIEIGVGTTLRAAASAGVARVVVRSVPGAAHGSDPLRAVCAEAEEALAALPMPTMAVRTSLLDTPEVRDAIVSVAPSVAEPAAVAPIGLDEAVAALVALDRARTTATSGHATFRLQGPTVPLRDWLDPMGDSLVGRTYRPASRFGVLAASLRSAWAEPTDDDTTADLLALED